jgi:hypothetical protein
MESDLEYTHILKALMELPFQARKSVAFSVRKNFVFPFSSPSAFSSLRCQFGNQRFPFSRALPDLGGFC